MSLRWKRALTMVSMAVFLSGASSCVPGHVIDVVPASEDCHTGCVAAAAGWPLPYIVDGHGLSPHGSADLIGMMLGLDRLDGVRAIINLLLWLSMISALLAGFAWWRKRIE